MSYHVINEKYPYNVGLEVERLVKEGYEPCGGLLYKPKTQEWEVDHWVQAMYKPKSKGPICAICKQEYKDTDHE